MSNTETLSGIILWIIYIIVGLVILYILKLILSVLLLIIGINVEKVFPKLGKAIEDFATKLTDDDNAY